MGNIAIFLLIFGLKRLTASEKRDTFEQRFGALKYKSAVVLAIFLFVLKIGLNINRDQSGQKQMRSI